MRSFKKKTRHVCIFYFSSVNISFTSISKMSISLGVRPLDPLLGLLPWAPLGDFRPPGYLPLCVNSSPKVTEPLTPLQLKQIRFVDEDRSKLRCLIPALVDFWPAVNVSCVLSREKTWNGYSATEIRRYAVAMYLSFVLSGDILDSWVPTQQKHVRWLMCKKFLLSLYLGEDS